MKSFLRSWSLLALLTFVASATGGAGAATPGGTVISNTASASYSDANGTTYNSDSNTILTTVASVSGVAVGPKENGCNPSADAYAVGANVTRTFTVTNDSNISDAYALTASTTAGSIVSLAVSVAGSAFTPLANGGTTPALAPGTAAQVQVTISTTGVALGTNTEISLQAKSTSANAANGQATDTASQCAVSVGKAVIGGGAGATSQVQKLVDGKAFEGVTAGQTVVYSIAYENYGGVPATGAVLTDTFPAGVTPNPATVALNGTVLTSGVSVSGQTLTVQLGSLAPSTLYTITVSALVSQTLSIGTEIVNTASVSAQNANTAISTPAAVIDGVANVVYDGYAGQSAPVTGAVVTLTNPSTGQPIALSGTASAPNLTNIDPFTTGADGTYSFGLGPTQIGPVTYVITITAPGYRSRQIQVTLTPDATGTFYTVTITALDGQPLAVPGGFALTAGPVTIAEISNLFGNLPLFRTQVINITKTVDRSVASAGDRLVYTITFSNVATPLGAATLVDTLPVGVLYAPGTALVDGVHVEPAIKGRTLTWTFPTLTSTHTVMYATVIEPGVTAGSTLHNVATVNAVAPNVPGTTLSASASADTLTINGVFTDQTIITGRVFIDRTKLGWFQKGDVGIPGVRIFMEDGESVVTDANGRYSFPGVRPGMHVLKLDRSTLPPGTRAYDVRDYDDQKSIRRLVHGVFDGGLIQDVNFAIEATS